MKKSILVCAIGIVLMCLLLSVFNGVDFRDYIPGMWDPHQGERPTDYVPSKWISSNPDICFEVTANDDNLNANKILKKGQIMLKNRTIDFTMSFDLGVSVYFYNADGKSGLLFSGWCEFYSDTLVVKIDKNKDSVFSGEIDKIVFKRVGQQGQ